MATTENKPVWFVTGCSTGFGMELAKHLLNNGYRAVVTARKTEDLAVFAGNPNALLLTLDVTVQAQVDAAVKAVHERFGRIDVLVNNAGLGYFGSVEESEEARVRWMFEVNVFGLGRMTSAVLPLMRAQKSGFIINLSSINPFADRKKPEQNRRKPKPEEKPKPKLRGPVKADANAGKAVVKAKKRPA